MRASRAAVHDQPACVGPGAPNTLIIMRLSRISLKTFFGGSAPDPRQAAPLELRHRKRWSAEALRGALRRHKQTPLKLSLLPHRLARSARRPTSAVHLRMCLESKGHMVSRDWGRRFPGSCISQDYENIKSVQKVLQCCPVLQGCPPQSSGTELFAVAAYNFSRSPRLLPKARRTPRGCGS